MLRENVEKVVNEPKKPMVIKLTISLVKSNLLLIIEKIIPIKKHPNKLHNNIPFGPVTIVVDTRYLDSAPTEPPKAI